MKIDVTACTTEKDKVTTDLLEFVTSAKPVASAALA